MTNHRVLGPAEARVLAMAGACLLGLAALAIAFPWLLAIPFGVLGGWIGITLLFRAARLYAHPEESLTAPSRPAVEPTTPPPVVEPTTPPPAAEVEAEPAAAQAARPH